MPIEKAMILISKLRACGLIPPDIYETLFMALECYRAKGGISVQD